MFVGLSAAALMVCADVDAQLPRVDTGAVKPVPVVVARYPLDGSVNDASGNGRHASLVGGSWTASADGTNPGALAFDGKTKLTIPANAAFDLKRFTVSLRVKTDFNAGGSEVTINGIKCRSYSLINSDGPGDLGLTIATCGGSSSGGAAFSMKGADGSARMVGYAFPIGTNPIRVNRNTWTEISVTYDGTTLRLSIDGVERANKEAPLPAAPTGAIVIGSNFAGALDEVKFATTMLRAPLVSSPRR